MTRVPGSLSLGPNEHVSWRSRAARPLAGKNVVGTLYLTETRLVFVTSRLKNLNIRSTTTSISLTDLESVGRQARTNQLHHAGFRTRLRVDMKDHSSALFVMRHVDEVVARLNLAIEAATSNHI